MSMLQALVADFALLTPEGLIELRRQVSVSIARSKPTALKVVSI
jgi:hypothetical protein